MRSFTLARLYTYGSVFPEDKPFTAEGPVENWLLALEFKTRQVLNDILREARGLADLWESEKQRRLVQRLQACSAGARYHANHLD
jgi:hypothetical protein